MNCSPGEIFFTSGGTEADNMAIRCGMTDLGINHAITTKIEHHAVGHTLKDMAKKGFIKLSYLDLDSDGSPDLAHLEELLQNNKRSFVSLMHANNEIGNLLPINQVGLICEKYNAIFILILFKQWLIMFDLKDKSPFHNRCSPQVSWS